MSVHELCWHNGGSGVARGGHGGAMPPPTFGKCFFSPTNWCCYVLWIGNEKKSGGIEGGLLSNVLFRQPHQIAMNVSILFEIGLLFCKVIFTNDFPIVTSSNVVKPCNGQLAFRREFCGICYFEDHFLPWHTFSWFVYTYTWLTFRHNSLRKRENVIIVPLVECCD